MLQKKQLQGGQTLIETIMAMFILVTVIVSSLGLALYALSTSAYSKNQTVATNLAREGMEVMRMFRDSNWLAAGTGGSDALMNCTYPASVVRPCYPDAFNGPVADMNSSADVDHYRLRVRTSPFGWSTDTRNNPEDYLLCLQADGTYQHNTGAVVCNTAQFARRVMITTGSVANPYTTDNNNPTAAVGHSPEKIIKSVVVWKGKGCVDFNPDVDPNALNTKCKVEVSESLTNWKDYR